MRETWVQSLGWEDSLEKGKATHSSILAWRIPWTVQSVESQRVRQGRLSELHSLTKHSKTPEAKHMEIGHSESKGFPRGRIASQTPMEWRAPKVMNPKPNPITFTEGVQRVVNYFLGTWDHVASWNESCSFYCCCCC